jgi:endonuclease/exonuclease/phosphatase family metal-dependent hydrolase
MPRLRVLTYNIHKGFSSGNTHFLLEQIRTAIRDTGADIVCLQEVIGHHRGLQEVIGHHRGLQEVIGHHRGLQEVIGHHRGLQRQIADWHPGGQFEYLADQLWPHFAYGQNAIYQQGHHGNATLSRFPFSHWRNIDISRWGFSQRGVLLGRVGEHLYVLCVHFGFLPYEQNFQRRCLEAIIREHVPPGAPLIIAGDFNDWHLRIHHQLTRNLHLQEATSGQHRRPAATYPARRPTLAMDRIYYRNLRLIEAQCLDHSHWPQLSDHCPVLADFQVDIPLTSPLTPDHHD